MFSETELLYVLALQRVPNLGEISAKKLIGLLGSAEAIFKEKKSNLLKIEGIGSHKLKHLDLGKYLSEAENELRFVKDHDIEYRYFLHKNYPQRLKHCFDSPMLYFQKGNIDLQNKRVISIVGTRKATTYGIGFCEKLLEDLAPLQPVIISGYAYGIDITAQKKAINLGLQTIGCLAHGFNKIYPPSHKKYVSAIEAHGGFITEFWSDDAFDRNNFLKRNRIIAGLSEATLVIESAEKGGSLVTADIANSYHRDVFAVPGRSTDLQSVGCNNLIKTQQAHLLQSAADLIYLLDWDLDKKEKKSNQTQLFVSLTEEEEKVYSFLKNKDKELLDGIALQCQMPIYKVAGLLLNLELKGLVRPLPGKLFQTI
ncbi:MAG: DNA-protecting protein DprA [Alteromonas sp.]|nr:DNA-protecting protein DprA [Alteromonas sp.]MAY23869.1 DNA-protecting protein DprA [Flavobacteriaceae bacterium]|tara:strand:- start:49294 stop:50400 length:1107 start_codon:yes stop_codon:yes gene_type:complete